VVLAGLRADPDASKGQVEATVEVVASATRHVIATTVTTVVGFTPLLCAGGGFWPPMVISIAGGVTGSTLLALYFVPSLHQVVAKIRHAENRKNA